MLTAYSVLDTYYTKGAITRPNCCMNLRRESAFYKLFSEHLVLHNLFSFVYSLQFLKLFGREIAPLA